MAVLVYPLVPAQIRVTICVWVWDSRTPSQHGSRLSTSSTSLGTSPPPTTWSNHS